jgi:hypothetical protein
LDKEDDNNRSIASTASSVNKLKKDFSKMKKAFTMVNTQLSKLKEADSDISDLEEEEQASHFQVQDAFQFSQTDQEFGKIIAKLFKQAHGSKIKLDLKEVILLDSQSTVDLFCNKTLVGEIKSRTPSCD